MPSSLATTVVDRRDTFLRVVRDERAFLIFLGIGFLMAGASFTTPAIAMWVGFVLAAYSTVANDSIQTIGTFIASNHGRRWWVLWLFIGGVFLATVSYGWWAYDGDVSFGRLSAKGFAEAPTSFTFLQVAAPLFLLILTRLRMPVSTTFLLLSCFSTSAVGIQAILLKSLSGYVVAFKEISVVTMRTTWVFIGLLGGRELGLSLGRAVGHRPLRSSWRLMRKDLAFAGIGLAVSIVLALAANTSLLD